MHITVAMGAVAAEIGKRAGLRYAYAGNLPGRGGTRDNTCWPSCQTLLIERVGSTILNNILKDGACPTCHTPIPGVWNELPHHLQRGASCVSTGASRIIRPSSSPTTEIASRHCLESLGSLRGSGTPSTVLGSGSAIPEQG